MNPLKTMKNLKKFMGANKGVSDREVANKLCPHARSGLRYMDIYDLVQTYRKYS